MQQGMLFDSELMQSRSFLSQAILLLAHQLDIEKLTKAINEVLNSYEIMRCSLVPVDAQYQLARHSKVKFPVITFDLKNDFMSVEEIAYQQRSLSFKVHEVPLIRVALIREAQDKHHLIFTYPHYLLCASSAFKILNDIFRYYDSGLDIPTNYYQHFLDRFNVYDKPQERAYWEALLAPYQSSILSKYTDPANNEGLFECSLLFPHKISEQLKQTCRKYVITPNLFFQSIISILLSKYCDQQQVCFGVIRAFPSHIVVDSVGLLINMLPVLVDVGNLTHYGDIYAQLKQQGKGLKEYSLISLMQLHKLARVKTGQPMFNVVFDFKPKTLIETLKATNPFWKNRDIYFNTETNHALLIEVVDTLQGYSVRFNGLRSWFSEHYTQTLLSYFETLVVDCLKGEPPSLCGDTDQLEYFSVPEFMSHSLQRILRGNYQTYADKVAIIDNNKSYSYKELGKLVLNLSHCLTTTLSPRELVPVYLDRGIESVVSVLAIINSGCVYVPLDPNFPTQRIQLILADLQAKVCLTSEKYIEQLPKDHGLNTIIVDIESLFFQPLKTQEPIYYQEDSLVYVIFTSGTTGQPKGAMNHHLGVLNRLLWMQNQLNISSKDVILHKTPLSFDVSIWELFLPFLTGATMSIVAPKEHINPHYLLERLKQDSVTVLHFVPSMLAVALPVLQQHDLKNLRMIICSGEALPFFLQERIANILPNLKLYNLYGPSEAAIDVTYYDASMLRADKRVPIGKAIANTKLYVLDRHLKMMPRYAIGELMIGQVAAGLGYWSRPELTTQSFIQDPFDERQQLLYKTGDLVRLIDDNLIEYIGRRDNQVKVNGMRIELDEINQLLCQYDGVDRAYTTFYKNEHASERFLLSYITGDAWIGKDISSLKGYLAMYLPKQLVPKIIIHVDTFFVTHNGKIDTKSLPEPRNPGDNSFNTWRNIVDVGCLKKLLSIVKSVLKIEEQVNDSHSFVGLGGDSLAAMSLAIGIQEQFKVIIDVNFILASDSLVHLANEITQAKPVSCDAQEFSDHLSIANLSLEQQGVYFEQIKNHLSSHAYKMNAYFMIETEGFTKARIIEGVRDLLNNHRALRVRLIHTNEGVRQKYEEDDSVLLFVHQEIMSVESILNELSLISQEKTDLFSSPLCQLRLFSVDSGSYVLYVSLHHMVCDGISIKILKENLKRFFNNEEMLKESMSYFDYVCRQELIISPSGNETVISEVKYRLLNVNFSPLPIDFLHTKTAHSKRIMLSINEETLYLLKHQCQLLQCTPFVYFLACYAWTIYIFSGVEKFAIGVPVAARSLPGLQSTVGLFVNLVPCIIEINTKHTFRSFIHNIKFQLSETQRHAHLPDVVMQSLANRDGALQIIFNYSPDSLIESKDDMLEGISYNPLRTNLAKHPLKLELFTLDDSQCCYFEYADLFFSFETIESLSTYFLGLLTNTLKQLETRLDELEFEDKVVIQ